jgi:Family of unknown function (DUF5681)
MGRDKVGYGRPPKATQFKPGKSGNPKGRPKGSLNLVTDLAAELSEQITVREDGRTRRLSKQRALIKSLLAKGIQGDVRAAAAILALYAKVNVDGIDDGSKSLDDAELAILKRFGPRLLKSLIGKDDVS